MKRTVNLKWMILLVVLTGLSLPGAFAVLGQQAGKLAGTWKYTYNNESVYLEIKDGNQLVFDGETASYELVESAIRVYDEYGYYFDYRYVLDQDKLSITFPDGYAYLFEKVRANPAAKEAQAGFSGTGDTDVSKLFGSLCSYSGSSGSYSSYSSSKVLSFNGTGLFRLQNTSSYSGGGDLYYNSGEDNSQYGTYRIIQGYVELKYANGSFEKLKINVVQNSGEITELMAGSVLYAKALCE